LGEAISGEKKVNTAIMLNDESIFEHHEGTTLFPMNAKKGELTDVAG
jgi:hypothetical protein